jgi:hypothetical protein
MATVRRHVRLVLAGQKFDLNTNAVDMVKADRDGEGELTRGMRVLHQACLRQRVEGVPVKFDVFLEQLDDIEDLDDLEAVDAEADPTPTTA